MERTIIAPSRNGTPSKSKAASRPRKPPRLSSAQRSALILGGIGVSLLILSLSHCTEAIHLLTGSNWVLSALLAVGIDAGMVAAEWATLTAHDRKSGREVAAWANAYILSTCVLSMVLNCYAFGLHVADGMTWAAWILGVFVPAAVFTLGRIAGKNWLS